MMRNVIAITMLFSLIGSFAGFDIVAVLTNGGPLGTTQVFATSAFTVGILSGNLPLGAAVVAVHGADPGGGRDPHPARRIARRGSDA